MQDILTAPVFSQHLDQIFTIHIDGMDPVELTLTEVEITKLSTLDARYGLSPEEWRTPFSLMFRGPYDPLLPQRLYDFSHPEMGDFQIFIVPLGRGKTGTTYQSVFT